MNTTTKAKAPTLYGYPCPVWVLPNSTMTPLIQGLYSDALEVLIDPQGPVANAWAAEIEEEGYRAITAPLSLPIIHSLVAELPDRAIARLTGRRPTDAARQEAVRSLYAPVEP